MVLVEVPHFPHDIFTSSSLTAPAQLAFSLLTVTQDVGVTVTQDYLPTLLTATQQMKI